MKILSLHFKNLNSLYGEWHIDFTDKNFVQDGLFLLTGPTGAGKSTILDAICLALYGQTPRLGKITQSSNEIMSKHTADCYALLHFETKGVMYFSRFEQRRARNSANGKLQDVERSIAKERPDNIICRKKTEINDEIIKITGMDFPRFTRSILLAQGAFDSFLKARDEEKSMLLEQITGTEIYSEISKHVFERTKAEREKEKELAAKAENARLLSDRDLLDLEEKQKNLAKEQQEAAHSLNRIQKNLIFLNNSMRLQDELNKTEQNLSLLLSEQEQAKEKKEQLEKAEKAEKISGLHQVVLMQENELKNLAEQAETIRKNLPQTERRLQILTADAERITQKIKKEKEELEGQKPLFETVKKLDIQLEAKKQTIEKLQSQIKEENTRKLALEKRLSDLAKEKQNLLAKQNTLQSWLEENKHCELLGTEYSLIRQNLQNLQATLETGQRAAQKINELQKVLTEQKKQHAKQEQLYKALLNADENQQKQEQDMDKSLQNLLQGRLLREWETELNHLEEKKYLLYKIAGYEEQRRELTEGSPCPLCGSAHHPYALQKAPEPSQTEQDILAIKKRLETIKNTQQELEKIRLSLAQNKKQIGLFSQNLQEHAERQNEKEKELAEAHEARQNLLDRYAQQKQELLSALSHFRITEIQPDKIEEINRILQQNLQTWQNRQQEKQELEKQKQELEKQETGLQSQNTGITESLRQKNTALQNEESVFSAQCKERTDCFQNKNPLEEEEKLTKQIKETENAKEKLLAEKDTLTKTAEQAKASLAQLEKTIAEKNLNRENCLAEFNQGLAVHGFSCREEFLATKLEEDRLSALQKYFKNLEQNIRTNAQNRQELEKQLREQEEKQQSDPEIIPKPLEEYQAEERSLKEHQAQILLNMGELQGMLAQNEKNRQENAAIKEELEKQRKTAGKWESLNQLIGSADGKKFRTIAQGITFARVVQFANQKLQLLQKRYLLVPDDSDPLSLNVLDNYQGGEKRAVQNLSGGESFMVSLSLALGLAQMASKNVQVDSLFLDEGFGTLDEESLDTALSTLANIQQEGKLIGIISHIGLLKERIGTQISIIPAHGGKSVIQGAGCQKIG